MSTAVDLPTPTQSSGPRLSGLPLLFRPAFLERALAGTHEPLLREAVTAAGLAGQVEHGALGAALDTLYGAMVAHYRCEYVFKTAVLASVMQTESLRDIVLVDELRTPECRPDILILNGTSSVYEIKSDLDSFERLPAQLAAQRKLFDRIHVVVSTRAQGACLRCIPSDIGVLLLDDGCQLRSLRPSKSHRDGVSPGHIFDCLRRAEYTAIIRRRFGSVPEVPPALLYRACRSLFETLSPRQAHLELTACLKGRREYMVCASLLHSVPPSLRYLCAAVTRKPSVTHRLENLLHGMVSRQAE